jgi:hypothetical protein
MDPASELNLIKILRPCRLHFHIFLPTFSCFFRDAIEEIYNKDASLSIHIKKLFTSVHSLRFPIERGGSGILCS